MTCHSDYWSDKVLCNRWFTVQFDDVQALYDLIVKRNIFEPSKRVLPKDKSIRIESKTELHLVKYLVDLKIDLRTAVIFPAYNYRGGWVR